MDEVETWLRAFAQELERAAPDEATIEKVLKLAAVAAHSSARQAAPVACWMAGATGMELDEAIRVAESLAVAEG